jgi:copper chaperone NosL
MMKQRFVVAVLAVVFFSIAGMAAFAQSDIDEHRFCANCGMDRKAYGYSRMLIQYQDGAVVGVCSLHCAVAELDANKARSVKSLLVADRNTRELIDAEKAIWVKGGKKHGVMSQLPTWAFATKTEADAFIKTYGGEISPWSDVLASIRSEASPTPQ